MSEKPYIATHPVGYIDLEAVEEVEGKKNAESLREHLEEAATDGNRNLCSYEELEAKIEESGDSIEPEIVAFLKQVCEELSEEGATGDIYFYP